MIDMIYLTIVITYTDQYNRGKVVQLGNWEQIIVIAYINSKGQNIPPFLIVQGKNHFLNWYTNSGLLPNQVIKPISNRQINNKTGLEQLKYFDKYTITYTKGLYRILVLNRYKNYKSAEFQEYYKIYNIIILGLPSYLFYLTQLFDIRYFSILKQVYSWQIKIFIKAYINYITKIKFFLAFIIIYKELMIIKNYQTGFYKTDLVPFNL